MASPVPPPNDASAPSLARAAAGRKRKVFWTKQFYLWHWVSSAICLAGMVFFAFTGITLNHAADIPAKPVVSNKEVTLPDNLRTAVAPAENSKADFKAALPAEVSEWLSGELDHRLGDRKAEWSESEIYLSLPRPGGDAWLTIDRETGAVKYELSKRGAISFLNDLHKGRHTGRGWAWFLDIFSGACVIFSITGLGLLVVHAKRRPSTWWVVGAGVLIPLILIIFFMH